MQQRANLSHLQIQFHISIRHSPSNKVESEYVKSGSEGGGGGGGGSGGGLKP